MAIERDNSPRALVHQEFVARLEKAGRLHLDNK